MYLLTHIIIIIYMYLLTHIVIIMYIYLLTTYGFGYNNFLACKSLPENIN